MAITSLFGPSPAEIIMAQQKETQQQNMLRNQQIAQQGREFGVFAPLYQAGLRFGDVASQAAMQGLFPQQVDPRLQEATAVQSVLSKYADQDQTDPNVLAKIGKDLMPVAPNAGLKALSLSQQLTKESVFGKVDPSKFTPASLQRFAQTKDYKDLQPLDKVVSEYRTLSPADVRSRGLNPNTVYQEEVATGKLTQVGQSPAVVFNAPLMTSETEYAKGIGKTAAEKDTKQFEAAESAVNNLTKINTTLNELQTSDAVTGLGAEVIKNVERAKALFLADKKAGKKVTDTEYLDALLGSDVFPMISALGIGARGLDTPAEREYLRQVFTGTITMNKDTLIKLTQIRKNIEEKAINKYNERVDKGEYNRFFKMQGREPVKFEIPTMPAAPQPGSVPGQKGWSAREIK